MKTVFTDVSEVAHLWANQLQDNARNRGNFYFEGKTIYSYGSHFPIAKHVENSKGEKAILFTERSYSHTTNQHKSVVRHAANHIDFIYCWNPNSTHDQNLSSFKVEVEKIAENLLKAKKPEKYLNEIEVIKNKAYKYLSFFDLPMPEYLQIAFSITDKESYQQYTDKKEALRIETEKKAALALKKRHAKELKDWLSGKSHRLYTRDGYDYLRVNGDKVETSQGVDLSVPYALKIYNRLKEDKLNVGDKVLEFNVLKINGVVTIGCHNFKKSYLLDFGKKLEETAKETV